MKRLISVLLVFLMVICLCACGNSGTKVTVTEENSSGTSTDKTVYVNSIEELEQLAEKDVSEVVTALETEYNELIGEITTYDQYV